MTFLIKTNTFLFFYVLFIGCVAPSQEGVPNSSYDTGMVNTILDTNDVTLNMESSIPELDTTELIQYGVTIQTKIEPTKTSEPTIEQRQIKLDTFSIFCQKHNDEDSSDEHKKRCYEFQSKKVKVINDTMSLIDEKFKKIEERIRSKK